MSKADEKSKQYRDFREQCGIKDPVMLNEIEEAYFEGYQQAEKDLELTWEDIPEIFRISEQLKTSWWFRDNEQTKLIGTQVFWEEVLKRFQERKEKQIEYEEQGDKERRYDMAIFYIYQKGRWLCRFKRKERENPCQGGCRCASDALLQAISDNDVRTCVKQYAVWL